MIRRITLLFLACFYVTGFVRAQSCFTDQAHQHLMATNPAYAQSYNQFNTGWANWMASQSNPSSLLITLPGGQQVYEIPVVVHVMDPKTGPAYYLPTDDTIKAWIEYTNKVWEATWPAFPSASTGGTRIPIRFALAKRDPNCAPTTGILRVDASSVADYTADGVEPYPSPGTDPGCDEITLKALSKWPNDQYYNIWVVHKIEGVDGTVGSFTAGYAFFPGAPTTVDGTVILATQFSRYPLGGNITLAHEFGHAFNLEHTFKDGCGAASTSPGCTTTGDFCCDTEPMAQGTPGTCPTNNSGTGCPNTPFTMNTQRNIMNYSNCQNRFTPNQRDRALAALLGPRVKLVSSLGATAIPSTPLPSVCVPTYANPGSPQNAGPTRVRVLNGTSPLLDVTSGGYISEGNKVYVDNTCKDMLVVNSGGSYNASIQTLAIMDSVRIYIDYNNDGVFGNSAGEFITMTNNTANPHTTSFTVPTSSNVVRCTPIRMRVVSDFATSSIAQCGPLQYGQAEDYSVMVLGGSGGGSIAVDNPPIGGNPSCSGTTITLTTTVSGSPTATNYAWYRKASPSGVVTPGPNCATCSTWNSNIFQNDDSVWVVMTYVSSCGTADTASPKLRLYRPLTVAPAVTIGLTYGTNPSCIDDSLSVTVTGNVNPGGGPTYQWRVNNINQGAPTTNPAFNATGLAHGSVVSVIMTSSATGCAFPTTATSNNVTINRASSVPTVTVALTGGTNPGCANQILTFTAIPTTGGTNPVYQWFLNGNPVSGNSTNTYSGTFANNDQVSVRMTSNSPCASVPTVTSLNTITVTHTLITANVTAAQIGGTNPACSGKAIAFGATTINSGANPTFQWFINGSPVANATGVTYITDSMKNGDILKVVMTSTDPCVVNPTDTSNDIMLTVIQSKIPTINISITKGKNPGCLDSLVEFTAISTDIGNNPFFTWKINTFDVSFGSHIYSSNAFLNGDEVICCVNSTDGGCYLPDTICSSPFKMVRSITPDPPLIHLIGNKLIAGQPGSYVWFGPNGRQNAGGENGTFLPSELGEYWAVTNNNGCFSKPSNILKITLLDISTINMDGVTIYPNPTSGKVTIDWGRNINSSIEVYSPLGQRLMSDRMVNESRKDLDLGQFANGIYYIVIIDENGKTGNVKITVAK